MHNKQDTHTKTQSLQKAKKEKKDVKKSMRTIESPLCFSCVFAYT